MKLKTTTTGIAFAIALDVDQLTDAFGCAVDGEVGDTMLGPIEIAPEADVLSAATGLTLDPALALVAADIDPRAGHVVRFIVGASEKVRDARAIMGDVTYLAKMAPDDDAHASSMIFEIPARAWAEGVMTGEGVEIDATLDGGAHRALRLRPAARVARLSDDDDDGC